MNPDVGFPVMLAVTVLLLGGVVATGMRGRLRVHLALVATAVLSLVVTIWFAEQLGDHYDLDSAGVITPIHLTFAKIATLSYVLPLVTGLRTLKDRRKKPLHFKSAMLVLALTLVTFVTGLWMILAADRLDGPVRDSRAAEQLQLQGDPR